MADTLSFTAKIQERIKLVHRGTNPCFDGLFGSNSDTEEKVIKFELVHGAVE